MSQLRQLALLTTDNLEDFYVYDHMLDQPFLHQGWQTHHISWREKDVDWSQYDVVVVRSTWDYQQAAEEFLETLAIIDASSALLENDFELMKWNMDKIYLRDLSDKNIEIVPSQWHETLTEKQVANAFDFFQCDTLIIKPTVSANADDTYRLNKHSWQTQIESLKPRFESRTFMLQPFLESVLDPGEYSLFYFNGQYSHAILKTPKRGDFRVQEEHGGELQRIAPNNDMKNFSQKVLNALPSMPLYARIDIIEHSKKLALMEVELIEPSLYFNMAAESTQHFVNEFCRRHA